MPLWYDEVFEGNARFGLKVGKTLYSERSAFQTIEIFETERFGRTLALDGIYQTSEADEFYYHEMLVQPALVTAPAIRRVLLIGGGDGGSAREILRHPEVEQLVMVELDSMVVEASRRYLPTIGSAWEDPRLEVRFEDGIAYAAACNEPFDVILIDGPDPLGPAVGLFESSFYTDCERLLGEHGVLAQQTESPVFMPRDFYRIVRTLRDVFVCADPYFGPVPVYASSLWSYTYASSGLDPKAINTARAERIEPHMRYYTTEIHRAAFALPREIQKKLDAGQSRVSA
ncbi:MAG: polyamine aminopropyltransferase [Proteobacteria bacterium]|nr:polyamine aminopropyltransferase [Pseudomonadota bacterium]